MNHNEKLGIKIAVDGTPIENQLRNPLTIIEPEYFYEIASVETESGFLPIKVNVKNGAMTSITFDLQDKALQISFTLPENGQFMGELPLPCIPTSTDILWISFILCDEYTAGKHLTFTIYQKH